MPYVTLLSTKPESKAITVTKRIGLRWCSDKDVLSGKGKTTCGNKHCSETGALHSYEVNMTYLEGEVQKQTLVKVNLCPECAMKLNYKRLKDKLKKKKKKEKEKKKKKHKEEVKSEDSD